MGMEAAAARTWLGATSGSAKRALDQINTAFETMRGGGNAKLAATLKRLPKTRDLVTRLSGQ